MPQQYAKDQPEGFKNRVEKIAIVGVRGNLGEYMAKSLLQTGIHRVTALTRADSPSLNSMPAGLTIKKVNYDDPNSLIDALTGQDVLIITLAVTAPPDTQDKLIDAAAAAGVPWILPNEYGSDPSNESLQQDTLLGEGRVRARQRIERLGVSSWIGFCCSFWYEYSLAGAPGTFGFDFAGKTVTLYDEGTTRINTTTWEQCGRATAALLSLKVLPEDSGDDNKGPTLSMFRNDHMYVSSFLVSQRDMFESVLRVSGDAEDAWTVRHEDVKERYRAGMEEMRAGDRTGFMKLLYARVFYPGDGDYESKRGLHNDILGLPKEDFDEATKRALDMVARGGSLAARRG
ncbi:hypothetical protein G647_02519 [Cladophialophora carrionii CBS 160.54]|uniref:NmrA-like domain-containing protein n=1 Tax=Cladophialophora carrionii CBS 160.54 TaxID=1279043 RepID=V9DFV1_9EURO|nr:uncharacterized protein G647_02519 [Cladophialophora carrionii CBS 160.54]ETI25745.1 hypothetical protein G647_02519 [Cladophialophora carrionii CBS 160.54]